MASAAAMHRLITIPGTRRPQSRFTAENRFLSYATCLIYLALPAAVTLTEVSTMPLLVLAQKFPSSS